MSIKCGIVLQRSFILQSYGSRIFHKFGVTVKTNASHALPNSTMKGKYLIQAMLLL